MSAKRGVPQPGGQITRVADAQHRDATGSASSCGRRETFKSPVARFVGMDREPAIAGERKPRDSVVRRAAVPHPAAGKAATAWGFPAQLQQLSCSARTATRTHFVRRQPMRAQAAGDRRRCQARDVIVLPARQQLHPSPFSRRRSPERGGCGFQSRRRRSAVPRYAPPLWRFRSIQLGHAR